MSEKRKCSGIRCPINNPFDTANCKGIDDCQFYTAELDFSGIEAVIDLIIKTFDLK